MQDGETGIRGAPSKNKKMGRRERSFTAGKGGSDKPWTDDDANYAGLESYAVFRKESKGKVFRERKRGGGLKSCNSPVQRDGAGGVFLTSSNSGKTP